VVSWAVRVKSSWIVVTKVRQKKIVAQISIVESGFCETQRTCSWRRRSRSESFWLQETRWGELFGTNRTRSAERQWLLSYRWLRVRISMNLRADELRKVDKFCSRWVNVYVRG